MLALPSTKTRSNWDKWLKDEWNNEAKFAANLRLARGASIFLGAIFVFRNFGDAIFGA
ncbi:hypothetical protein TSOC_005162 [Tetrabaena socialis]|uniref:Uncharacterized protein n=1 Tax=Tetrabaena socialis TaxID=47790 RepID=A0A2J8A733_9CHLO|nr:hypothetical protein TSOC_005162 [Tetrabaena socialis]|eukprot:PNH08300.1 hypothetical protein TSOC_005162 [Tetrabaena socialis]